MWPVHSNGLQATVTPVAGWLLGAPSSKEWSNKLPAIRSQGLPEKQPFPLDFAGELMGEFMIGQTMKAASGDLTHPRFSGIMLDLIWSPGGKYGPRYRPNRRFRTPAL